MLSERSCFLNSIEKMVRYTQSNDITYNQYKSSLYKLTGNMTEKLFKKHPNLMKRLYWFPRKYNTGPFCNLIRDIKRHKNNASELIWTRLVWFSTSWVFCKTRVKSN